MTIDEYLEKSMKPDPEYLDGELRLRSPVDALHSRILALLCGCFGDWEQPRGFLAYLGVRTRVSPSRVRLPDFALASPDDNSGPALILPPLLVIDILSENDTFKDLRERARDFAMMGTHAIWLIDPYERMLFIWSGEAWLRLHEPTPMTPAGAPLDLAWLWREAGLPEADAPSAETAS